VIRSALPAMASPELSVVIPAFNEEARLGATLEKIRAFFDAGERSFEVLVADDGSADRTVAVAEALGDPRIRVVRLPRNQGKGAATRLGVLASQGSEVLLTDADLSTPIGEVVKLEAALADAELAIGSRAVADARIRVRQPFYREFMGKTFNKIIWLLGVRGVRDTQCGFKLLAGDRARELFAELVTPGFAYDVELVWLAQRRGWRVREVGVEWENSPMSRVHPLRDPPRMILEILRFRRHHGRRHHRRRPSATPDH